MRVLKISFIYILLLHTFILGKTKHADRDPLLLKGIELLLDEYFDSSIVYFDSVSNFYSNDPVPLFFKGMVYFRKAFNMKEFDKYSKVFLKYWESGLEICEKNLQKNPEDAYALFFKGGILGYIGNQYVIRKSFFKGASNAYSGIRALQKSYELDSTYIDMYYGLGLYHVTAANSSNIVKFLQKLLPIPYGDEELGIKYLRLCTKEGFYSKVLSQALLAYVYTYYRPNIDSAIFFIQPLIEKYPRSTDFLITAINAYAYDGLNNTSTDWTQLLSYINKLESRMEERKEKLTKWYSGKLLFLKGYSYFMLKDFENAKLYLNKFTRKYKDNEYKSVAYLTLGFIEDINNNRKSALSFYNKASKGKKFGNLVELLNIYKSKKYNFGEKFFKGFFYELPDKL